MAPPFFGLSGPHCGPPAKASAGLCEARVARGELVYVSVRYRLQRLASTP